MSETTFTPFSSIYDSFLTRVTSDMYMELTENDTYQLLQDLLVNAIPRFEFPRFDIFDYELGTLELIEDCVTNEEGIITQPAVYEWTGGCFHSSLTKEEINILSLSMVVEWLGQQLVTTENTRMKFSGQDFKFTSQANHMAKLKNMIELYKQDCIHLQRIYKRRRIVDGKVQSTLGDIVTKPSYGYNIQS